MPIHVTIAVNERTISRVHIARISNSSGRNPNAVHTYAALAQEHEPRTDNEWEDGAKFTHRYGDSIEKCVSLAMEALIENGRIAD